MPRFPGVRRFFRIDRGVRDVHDHVDDELRFHIDSAVRDLTEQGMTPDEARREAERRFGDLGVARERLATIDTERVNSERRAEWWSGFWQDARHASRSLRRTPIFSITAVCTLSLGLGAVTAMFAILYGVLLEPLPYGHPDRLVAVWHGSQSSNSSRIAQTPGTYFTYKRLARTIESICLFSEGSANVVGTGDFQQPERVAGTWMTASVFGTLQVSPVIGRAFTEEEDRPGGPNVVLISESLWQTRFGGSRDVIGKSLTVNNVPRQIIGVMPERFRFPTPRTQLWLPGRLSANDSYGGGFNYSVIARLRPHVAADDARRDFAGALSHFAELYPNLEHGLPTAPWVAQVRPAPVIVPLREDVTGGIARTLWTVAAAAMLVLFVACANVSNLLLVRSDARQRELAVREALGAGRRRIIAHFFAESAIVVGLAGATSLLAAWVAVRLLVAFGPAEIPRLADLHISPVVVGFDVACIVGVVMICAAVPAFRVGYAGLSVALREGARTGTSRKSQHRLRSSITAMQLALALMVTAASGVLLRSFQRLHDVRPGFDPSNVTTFWMQLPIVRYNNDSLVLRFYSRLIPRVAELPGVRRVGLASQLPLGGDATEQSPGGRVSRDVAPTPLYVDEDRSAATKVSSFQTFITIDGGYLATMGVPLIAGRSFDPIGMQRDVEVVVSQRTAWEVWADSTGRAAIGKRFRLRPSGPSYMVIGVVGDVRNSSLAMPPSPTVYLPEAIATDSLAGQRPRRTLALVVKASGPRDAVTTLVQRAVRELDPTLPIFNVESMSARLNESTARLSFAIALLSVAAVITLILGAIGLYGVMAYVVSLRTHELGVRLALGATPGAVAMMMARRGLEIAVIGTAVGLLLFAPIGRLLRSFLYGVAPGDPLTLIGASATLIAMSLLASWIPASRAAKVDPAGSLKAE